MDLNNQFENQYDKEFFKNVKAGAGWLGLGGSLALWFVVLGIFPAMCVGIFAYRNAYVSEQRFIEKTLDQVILLKSREVESYFARIIADVRLYSRIGENVRFMANLASGFKESGGKVEAFLKSETWADITSADGELQALYGIGSYADVLLIDPDGNILYSAASDYSGGNVFRGRHFGTRFSLACRKSMTESGPVFSDYNVDTGPVGKMGVGYLVSTVKESSGELRGLLAVRISNDSLVRLMTPVGGEERPVDIYLVGRDHWLRSDIATLKGRKSLMHRIQTDPTQLVDFDSDSYKLYGISDEHKEPGFRYIGPKGTPVFGMHRMVNAGGIDYVMIAEVEKELAFVSTEKMKNMILFMIGSTLIIVILSVIYIIQKNIRPIRVLTGWVDTVATGDLSIRNISVPKNEIGSFYYSFVNVVTSLKQAARLAGYVAAGDYTADIKPRSKDDELGLALKGVVELLRDASCVMESVAGGDFDVRLKVKGPDDYFAESVNKMALKVEVTYDTSEKQAVLKTLQADLNETMRGEEDITELTGKVVSFLCTRLGAGVGAFYVADNAARSMTLYSSYAFDHRKNLSGKIEPGVGVAGQAVLEKRTIILENCPDDYICIRSTMGDSRPATIIAFPFIRGGNVVGVVELAMLRELVGQDVEFLELVSDSIYIAVTSALSRSRMKGLLDKTVKQSEALEVKQEELNLINKDLQKRTTDLQTTEAQLRCQEAELRATNEDLVLQTEKLKASENQLKVQEEELLAANEELETRSVFLEQQKNSINEKNVALEKAQKELIENTEKLKLSSRYKSEFLANMSHELRTPLNSILLISRLLYDNKGQNLTEKQVEYAKTVNSSGIDLLTLIDDVLDLSKIESGKLELNIEQTAVFELKEKIIDSFDPIAREKGIELIVKIEEDLPQYIYIDLKRVDQVIKNLVSNAVKFTSVGYVRLTISYSDSLPATSEMGYDGREVLKLTVEDTGTGIPEEKKQLIFEAFQQADGTINRQFGGTGLGLPISRELIKLMGGDISLESNEGQGSCFTVVIPDVFTPPKVPNVVLLRDSVNFQGEDVQTPHERISPVEKENSKGDAPMKKGFMGLEGKKVLVVDDDMRNVYALINSLEEEGLEILVGRTGQEGLNVLEQNPDTDLVFMDIMMPEMDGYEALAMIRKQSRFNKLPVVALTAKAMKGDREKCIEAGATDYLAKPVNIDQLLSIMKEWLS